MPHTRDVKPLVIMLRENSESYAQRKFRIIDLPYRLDLLPRDE
jgi:hypothetical protein